MRRRRRLLWTATLSALATAALLSLWGLSYARLLSADVRVGHRHELVVGWGCVDWHNHGPTVPGASVRLRSRAWGAGDDLSPGLGFDDFYAAGSWQPDGTYWLLTVPLWLPTVAAGAVFAWSVLRFRAAPRWPAGCCRACGYDLRSGHRRCPECGAAGDPPALPPASATETLPT